MLATFELSLSKLQQLKSNSNGKLVVELNPKKLRTLQTGEKFELSDSVQSKVNEWSIQIEASEKQKAKSEVKQKHQGSKVTSELESDDLAPKTSNKSKKVKCLCVNGLCNEGESKCRECFDGFEGDLCDIRTVSYNRSGAKNVIEDAEEIEETVFKKGKKAKSKSDDDSTS